MSLRGPYQLLTTNLFSNPAPSFMFSNNKILVNKTFAFIIAFLSDIHKTGANIN